MLLTGVLAGGAVIYGTYAYNKSLNATQDELTRVREKLEGDEVLSAEDVARLKKYESTYGSSFNNVLLDKVNPNSLIRSNRKSHKIFQKNREKLKKIDAKKSPYVNETILSEKETGDFVEIDSVKPVDTYKVGKYVTSYDYLNETPNYMLSYTNSIFGHMHKGLKKEMEHLRAENDGTVSELANKEKQGKEIKKIKKPVQKDTWEYKLLVESQKDIANSRIVKDKILKGNGFFSKVWRHSTKHFGNHFIAGRAMNAHNTIKKRVKRNIALYQADSLKAYRELQTSLLDENELLDAKSEDVVKKFDDIFFTDANVIEKKINIRENEDGSKEEVKGSRWVESKLAFDPMQIDLNVADENGKLNIIDHKKMALTDSYRTCANLYKRLVAATFNMRQGQSNDYATLIKVIKEYGELMDGTRFEGNLPMCHGFFRTNSMRHAMSAGIIDGTDKTNDLKPEVKRTLDFARVMLMQCLTQVMFDHVNNNPNLFVNLEAFGKLSANYQTAKLAATALMNRVDFQENVQEEAKKEAARDDLRLHIGLEYFKKKMHEDLSDLNQDQKNLNQEQLKRYDNIIDKFFSYKAVNDPRFRDIIISIQKAGANEHLEKYIEKKLVKVKDASGNEITESVYELKNLEEVEEKTKDLQLKDNYNRLLKGQITGIVAKRDLIRRYVVNRCGGKTLGLKAIQDKLVDKIEDNLGEEMLLASWWGNMIEGCQVVNSRDEDRIGKEIKANEKQKGKNIEVKKAFKAPTEDELMNMCTTYFSKAVPDEILDEAVAKRCKEFKKAILDTISKHGANCMFDVEKLWVTDQKIGKILADEGNDAQQNFENYLKDMTATLSSNLGTINERMQVVSNSFVFNCRRNKVFDYIGANIFTAGTDLVASLTDYAIERIMQESLTDKATEKLEKNVSKALDESVLENRWKISSMLALNAKLMAEGEKTEDYTVERLVALFNEWNDEFTEKSNKIVELYQGIYMAPEQIEKEMAFFDEHAWLKEDDFQATVKAHIENLKYAGLLKTEKGANDVTIDGFLAAYRNRETAYEAQNVVKVRELFEEEIMNNKVYQSLFNNMVSLKTLFELVSESVKEDDEIAPLVASLLTKDITAINDAKYDVDVDAINSLTIGDFSKIKSFIGERLLPLATYFDTLPQEQLTNAIRMKCIEKAMKGALDLTTPENLVEREMHDEENREEIRLNRNRILLAEGYKEMGAAEVDKSRISGFTSKKDNALATRQKRIETAANFWKTLWKEEPDLARGLTFTINHINSVMKSRYETRAKEHIIDRKKEYTKEEFKKDYNDAFERLIRKMTDSGEDIFTRSEMCISWYKALAVFIEGDQNGSLGKIDKLNTTEYSTNRFFGAKSESQKELDEAIKPFLEKVRKFVAKHGMKYDDLHDAYNEMALMGNADILLGVGGKYEDTLNMPQDAYEEELHAISKQISDNAYTNVFMFKNIKYDDIKMIRKTLIGSKHDDTAQKRKALFDNMNYLALAVIDGAESQLPAVRKLAYLNGDDEEKSVKEYMDKLTALRNKKNAFEQVLTAFHAGNMTAGTKYGEEGLPIEEVVIKRYDELFRTIEKTSEALRVTRKVHIAFNEQKKEEAKIRHNRIELIEYHDKKGNLLPRTDKEGKPIKLKVNSVTFNSKEHLLDLGNENFILGVEEIIKNHREFVNGQESIKSIFKENLDNLEKNYQLYGAKDAQETFSRYVTQMQVREALKNEEQNSGAREYLEAAEEPVKYYKKNCDRIRANDQKVGVKDKMAIFLPVLFQDDRFMELMTLTGKKKTEDAIAENNQEIDAYLARFKEKVVPFIEAITKNENEYAFDMTTVVPQFIEHHKDELLNGSEVYTEAKDYVEELTYIQNAWLTRKSKGKSVQDVIDAKASSKLAITQADKSKIVKAIMREGSVSYQQLTDPDKIEGILKEYKSKWDSNLAAIKELPIYKKLLNKKLNGSVDKTLADFLCETYADKLITMPQMDLINCMSSFAENVLEVNATRSIAVDSKEDQDWDYAKEREIKGDIEDRLTDGRNALAPGNAAIRKAADSYYNGVSILSNARTKEKTKAKTKAKTTAKTKEKTKAKTDEPKQKLVSADKMEANREKIQLKIKTMKELKGIEVKITDDELDIMTELYCTGNVWDSFPLLWNSNIEEAFDSIRNLRNTIKSAIKTDSETKGSNTGMTDEIRDHEINRFILYMAAHGRLDYKGGADGFIIRKAEEVWHWIKSTFKVGKEDIKQEFVNSEKGWAAMYNAYGQSQSLIDNFTSENLNLKSQYVIDQCNSERMALQMAMFTMDEEAYNALREERKSLLVTSSSIATAVAESMKSNKSLKQDEKAGEIDTLIDVLTRGFIDYYGEDIKKLVPVRIDEEGEEVITDDAVISKERERIVSEIREKLSGKDVMYYIKAFSETEDAIRKEERTKKGPVTKRTVVSDAEFEAAVNTLGEKRAKKYASMNAGEKDALALIISQPFRFLATDRVGAINMVMDHDKVTEAYFHKMYHVEQDRSNAAAIDVINLLSGKKLDSAIDYMGAYERLAGRVGTKGGKEIFDQAIELMELCKERIDFYRTRDWDNIADPEKSIKLAGLLGKSKANTPQARQLKNAKKTEGMRAALLDMVDDSLKSKLAKVDMTILVTLLQNRSILDESTIHGKEGMLANPLMREQVVKDLCMNTTKRSECQKNAAKQMYINNAIMTLLSYQIKDDAKLENGLLNGTDLADKALQRDTVVDETLLSRAIDLADHISTLINSPSVQGGIMSLDEFNEKYHGNVALCGKTKPVKYANDLNGFLFKVNTVLKTQAVPKEFSVFKNKAGEKALAFRKSLADKWAAEYAKRQQDVEKLSEADKAAFAEAKKAIDKMIVPINKNDSEIKTDKFTA